jgi:hypothetical protein
MDGVAADDARRRLEHAWAERATRRRPRFALPGFARACVAAAIVLVSAYATMHAGADSALYGPRVGIENALVSLQSDRVAYLSQLYDERLAEASGLEAIGNALAASRAHAAQAEALRLLTQVAPDPGQTPEPSASTAISVPSPSPTPDPLAASGSPAPEPTASPLATPRLATAMPETPKPVVTPTPTPKPLTPKPVISPTPTPIMVHATGDVLYADGSRVDGACVSMSLDGLCIAGTINGKIDLTLSAKKGQTLMLYVRNYDAARGGTLHGKASVTVGGPEVLLGTITLR